MVITIDLFCSCKFRVISDGPYHNIDNFDITPATHMFTRLHKSNILSTFEYVFFQYHFTIIFLSDG